MLIGPYHIITYKNRKNETLIRDSECFFLFQLYNESVPAIGEVKEKVFGLGLQLIRFPLFRWQKQPIYIFKTANHLPVQISNYALLGPHKLAATELKTLAHILRESQAVFVFGYQEKIWFNAIRLRENEKLDKESTQQIILTTLQSPVTTLPPYSVIWPVIYRLLHILTFIPSSLK